MTRDSIACAAALLILAGCSGVRPAAPAVASDTDAKALTGTEIPSFIQDWGGTNVERIVAHYSDDASLEIPNVPLLTGKDAMRGVLKQLVSDPGESLALTAVQTDVAKAGDMAYTRGTYVLTETDPASRKVVTEKGKFVTLFKKQADGGWKAVQDINNPDAPAK